MIFNQSISQSANRSIIHPLTHSLIATITRIELSDALLRRRRRIDRALLEQRADGAGALIKERHALVHPLRLRLAEQEVIEELVHVHGPVLHVVAIAQAVRFAVVAEEIRFLVQPP